MFFFLTMVLRCSASAASPRSRCVLRRPRSAIARSGCSAFLIAIVSRNGSTTSLSRFGRTRIIVDGLMAKQFPDLVWSNFFSVAIAHTIISSSATSPSAA